MTNVLILIKGLGRGGAEQLLLSAAPHLDRSRFGYEIAYLLPWKTALVEELERHGIRSTCLEGARGPGWTRRLKRLVVERGISIVHAHSPVAATGARVTLNRKMARIVYTEHNVWNHYHPATRWGNMLTFPRNDHVFAVSREVADSIRYPSFLFRSEPETEVLLHGLNLQNISEPDGSPDARSELGIPSDVPVVGTVANLRAQKGHGDLLRSVVMVRRSIPGVRFVLVGLGPLEQEIRDEVARLDLGSTVVVAGFREDVPRMMAAFDLFVLPSRYEGLPIALLEAMALGKPVLATDVGGVGEVVEDGINGLLVPPRDPEALASATVRLLNDAPMRARLSEAAVRRARRFDIRHAVTRMEEVYGGLVT